MRQFLTLLTIFLLTLFIYFAVGTQETFKPKWALDHFNPLAKSLLNLRLDIPNPGSTYDLAFFKGKWYVPWGVLPALFLIPLQIIKGRFVPAFYLSIFFASLNVVLVYLLFKRVRREFLPALSSFSIFLVTALFAFGTTHFYVGTLGSSWHVNQMITSFFGTLGIYFIFKKKRILRDYVLSMLCFATTLLGRPTMVLLVSLPLFLYFWDIIVEKKRADIERLSLILLPLVFLGGISFLYNWLRFQDPLEFGYRFVKETPYLQEIKEKYNITSFKNVPKNLWYMFLEIPSLTYDEKIALRFNLNGNSIFSLTPPFLAVFLALPILKKKNRLTLNPYIFSLWLTSIVTIFPSLMHFSGGWMQFGYRYSLDITVPLLLLSVFGMKGRLNFLYILGILFSFWMYWLGINALM